MHRIAVEIPLMIVAAGVVASLVFVAGSAIEPSTPPVALAFTPQSALCTPSYCDPSELSLTGAGSQELLPEVTSVVAEEP